MINDSAKMRNKMLPSKEEATRLIKWAYDCNPGAWASHSKTAARAAEAIADKCGLDRDRAFVSGLLHDIGRYEGVTELRHTYAGYELLSRKGYSSIASICLSHSFPSQNVDEYFGKNDCTFIESELIKSFLTDTIYDDYDKLIQLCDAISAAAGVCLIEVRIIDVIRRYGFSKFTLGKIEAIFDIKEHFDEICGMNIYDLFHDEIREVSFK